MLETDIRAQARSPVDSGNLLARRIAERTGLPVAALFRGQFAVSTDPRCPVEGWCSVSVGGFYLHCCPELRLYRILGACGSLVAVVCGVAVTPEGVPLGAISGLDLTADDPQAAQRLESLIETLVGRFVAVTCLPGAARVYTDCAGDMGVLYDPQTRRLGSSLGVILYREIEERPDFDHDAIVAGRGNYVLGYVRDRHARRLPPNFRLDLEDFRPTRFWPREDSLDATGDLSLAETVERIVERLARNTEALLAVAPCLMPISGGQDSRTLVGATRHLHGRMAGFFGWHMHRNSRRDCEIGARIAERLGLDYTVIGRIRPSAAEVAAFFARTGWMVNGGGLLSLGMANTLPEGHLVLRGNLMELTRATEWGWRRVSRVDPDCADWGIKRLKLTHAAPKERRPVDLRQRYLDWRATIPGPLKAIAHDLSFVENYYANAGGARGYAHVNVTLVNPFADRHLFALTLGVPARQRRGGELNAALLARAAPDLADLPFV
ncbi:MAG: hypothetical protein ACK4KW_12455 [Gemmobacter sp.]